MAPQQQQLPQQPLRVGRQQETREQALVRLLLQAGEGDSYGRYELHGCISVSAPYYDF